MPSKLDHGLLVIHDEPDGTTSLSICAKVIDGKPANVYAQYFHARHVKIDDDVALTRSGSNRYTAEVVEVNGQSGDVVSVRHPRYDDPPAVVNEG
jgi:hypothetical protein